MFLQCRQLCSWQCCGSGMFIPNPGSDFFPSRILDPGSKVDKIPDPHQRNKVFLTQITDNKFSNIRSGIFIPDPGSGFFSIPDPGSRIRIRIPDPGAKKASDPGSWIPDPDPQYWFLGIYLAVVAAGSTTYSYLAVADKVYHIPGCCWLGCTTYLAVVS
jgi:hypothetical protein